MDSFVKFAIEDLKDLNRDDYLLEKIDQDKKNEKKK